VVVSTDKKQLTKLLNKIKINPGKISFGDFSLISEFSLLPQYLVPIPGSFWFYPFLTPKCTLDQRKKKG